MRLRYRFFGVMAGMVIFFVGCKEEDWVPPTISVLAPGSTFSLQVPDTLNVSFSASDETRLESITVRLMSDGGVQLTVAPAIAPHSKEYSGTVSLVVGDKNLTGGGCYVAIEANDGTNSTSIFIQGQVVPLAKELRGVYVLVRQGQASVVYRIDSLFQSAMPFSANSGDARLLCISSVYDKLVMSGGLSATVTCVDLSSDGAGWENTMPFVSDTTAYLDMSLDGYNVFLSGFDGMLRGYDLAGSMIINENIDPSHPENLLIKGEDVIADRRASNGAHFIDRYRVQNGFLLNTLQVPMDVKCITTKDDEEYYLVGMDGATPRLLIYEPSEPGYYDPHELPIGEVFTAMAGEGDMLFISHTDGVYRYRYNPTLLDLILPGTVPHRMVLDPVHGFIVMAVGNEVRVFDMAAHPLATVTLPGEVLDLDLHHTR